LLHGEFTERSQCHRAVFDVLVFLNGGYGFCWERPPFTEKNWCHRRLVAGWFETELGVAVPEWTVQTAQVGMF
jgi:hypothetical protein